MSSPKQTSSRPSALRHAEPDARSLLVSHELAQEGRRSILNLLLLEQEGGKKSYLLDTSESAHTAATAAASVLVLGLLLRFVLLLLALIFVLRPRHYANAPLFLFILSCIFVLVLLLLPSLFS